MYTYVLLSHTCTGAKKFIFNYLARKVAAAVAAHQPKNVKDARRARALSARSVQINRVKQASNETTTFCFISTLARARARRRYIIRDLN